MIIRAVAEPPSFVCPLTDFIYNSISEKKKIGLYIFKHYHSLCNIFNISVIGYKSVRL